MTVGELRNRLEGMDPTVNVVVLRETGSDSEWYEVMDVSLQKGESSLKGEKISFTYGAGPETWLFISVEEPGG